MKTIDLYYDYRSPYSYFLSSAVAAFAVRMNVAIQWLPVSIHALLNLQVGKAPDAPYEDPLPPVKRRYLVTDVIRGARVRNLPIRAPASLQSRGALQVSLYLEGTEHEARFRAAVWTAMWLEGRDVSDPRVLEACTAHSGGDRHERIQNALPPEYSALLIDRSVTAFAKGVFGVPSLVTDGEIFFGSDRLDVLTWWLQEGASGSQRGA